MKNKFKRNDDLFPWVKRIATKCGFVKLNRGKPYYIHKDETKVYRVVQGYKLKARSDGATPKRYGRLKLKQLDGTFKNEYTHKVICDTLLENDDPANKTHTHHGDGDRSNNRLSNLSHETPKANACFREELKKKRKAAQQLQAAEVAT